jgi:hypothetical protein
VSPDVASLMGFHCALLCRIARIGVSPVKQADP